MNRAVTAIYRTHLIAERISTPGARRESTSGTYDNRRIGRRDQAQDSPCVRSYSREQPLGPRNPD